MVFFSINKQKNGQQVCATYTWKTSVLESGGFALDLTCWRPPIWWWSCHLRVQTQGEIFGVKKWPASLPWHVSFSSTGCVKKALQGTGVWALWCQGWAHTQHKQHGSQGRITHCYPMASAHTLCCLCAFWLEITFKQASHGKTAGFYVQ